MPNGMAVLRTLRSAFKSSEIFVLLSTTFREKSLENFPLILEF